MSHQFTRLARWLAHICGSPVATILAVVIVVVWVATGPVFGFSTEWSFAGNNVMTVASFLIGFILLAATNHETATIRAQLAELVRSSAEARNELVKMDDKSTEEIEKITEQIAEEAKPDAPSARAG